MKRIILLVGIAVSLTACTPAVANRADSEPSVEVSVASLDFNDPEVLEPELVTQINDTLAEGETASTVSAVSCIPSSEHVLNCRIELSDATVVSQGYVISEDGQSFNAQAK